MRIAQVTYTTNQLDEMKEFYQNVLWMPLVEEGADSFSVQVGETRLTFRAVETASFHHFAFAMRAEDVAEMRRRIEELGWLIGHHQDGRVDFMSGIWKRPQFYFTDPQGNILEILPTVEGESVSEAERWVHIREVGMPLPHVLDGASRLQAYIPTAMEAESDTFSFYGDGQGVFVLVKEERPWFPTERAATIHPLEVDVIGEQESEMTFGDDIPVSIRVRTA